MGLTAFHGFCMALADSVPGVSGGTIAFILGFYDRFLALEAPGAVRVGLGFACQVVERLPALPHDMPLDLLCTENEILAWRRER